jgi:hypothetical protein
MASSSTARVVQRAVAPMTPSIYSRGSSAAVDTPDMHPDTGVDRTWK